MTPPTPRPKLVWAIAVFYFLSAGWTLLSFGLILSGVVTLPPEQARYFEGLSPFEIAVALLTAALNLVAVVYLFRLRKTALPLFLAVFGLSALLTAYSIVFRDWLAVMDGTSLAGAISGWAFNVAIVYYCFRLTRRGVLR